MQVKNSKTRVHDQASTPLPTIVDLKARLKKYQVFNCRQAKQIARLRRQSVVDPLTGIGSERALKSRGEASVSHALRYRESLMVLVFDLNDFGSYNKVYSEEAGDSVLKCYAQALTHRPSDVWIHKHGDTFVLIASGEPASVAQMLQRSLAATRISIDRLTDTKGWHRFAGECIGASAMRWNKHAGQFSIRPLWWDGQSASFHYIGRAADRCNIRDNTSHVFGQMFTKACNALPRAKTEYKRS